MTKCFKLHKYIVDCHRTNGVLSNI